MIVPWSKESSKVKQTDRYYGNRPWGAWCFGGSVERCILNGMDADLDMLLSLLYRSWDYRSHRSPSSSSSPSFPSRGRRQTGVKQADLIKPKSRGPRHVYVHPDLVSLRNHSHSYSTCISSPLFSWSRSACSTPRFAPSSPLFLSPTSPTPSSSYLPALSKPIHLNLKNLYRRTGQKESPKRSRSTPHLPLLQSGKGERWFFIILSSSSFVSLFVETYGGFLFECGEESMLKNLQLCVDVGYE